MNDKIFTSFIPDEEKQDRQRFFQGNSGATRVRFDDDWYEKVVPLLHNNSTLTDLRLAHCQNSYGLIEAIVPWLSSSRCALTSLDLSRNGIDGTNAAVLASVLCDQKDNEDHRSCLTALYLNENPIHVQGAKAIATCLVSPPRCALRILTLSCTVLCDEGVQAMIPFLRQQSTLIALDISSNFIGSSGIESIAAWLQDDDVLLYLCLRRNSIGEEGTRALARCLQKNTCLMSLDLNHGDIHAESMVTLASALCMQSALTTLHIDGNPIGETGEEALISCLRANHTLTSVQHDSRWTWNATRITSLLAAHHQYALQRTDCFMDVWFIIRCYRIITKERGGVSTPAIWSLPLDVLLYLSNFFYTADFGWSKAYTREWIKIVIGAHRKEMTALFATLNATMKQCCFPTASMLHHPHAVFRRFRRFRRDDFGKTIKSLFISMCVQLQ